jgi:hypothetical protein
VVDSEALASRALREEELEASKTMQKDGKGLTFFHPGPEAKDRLTASSGDKVFEAPRIARAKRTTKKITAVGKVAWEVSTRARGGNAAKPDREGARAQDEQT